MKNFTVITDPGIDDLIALMLLFRLNPKAQNCLISTFGNADEKITASNTKEFIAFIANSWQFMNGSKLPLNRIIERPWPDYFHGPDGVWGVHPNVEADSIPASRYTYPTNDEVISLAPMNDTYKLLLSNKKANFTVMGGAFNIEGNETKYAETNIAFDPDAAVKFFENCEKNTVKIVPLDVTRKVSWDRDLVKSIPESDKINSWLKKLLSTWFEKYNHEKEESFNLHDPLAVYLAFYPEKAKWHTSGVHVVAIGEHRGQTIMFKDNPNCQIALDLHNSDEISSKIFDLIFYFAKC